jgi:hypothetical protein
MPIRRMLEGRNFDPEAVAILVKAFNGMVDELHLQTVADRERAAKIIIGLALARVTLDAKLRVDAVRMMRKETAAAHGLNPNRPRGLRGDQGDAATVARADPGS